MTESKDKCPKCGSEASLRISGTKFECDSVLFKGGQFFQSKLCKANIRIAELEAELERLKEECDRLSQDAIMAQHGEKWTKEELGKCREALEEVLGSAAPRKHEHPAMYEAWQKGYKALASRLLAKPEKDL
jgi:ribosomal protein S27AE